MVTILLEIISLGIMIILGLVMLFSKAFLERITLVNSFVLASALGIYAYLCNRHINAFFDFQIHQAICFVIGLAAFFLFYFNFFSYAKRISLCLNYSKILTPEPNWLEPTN